MMGNARASKSGESNRYRLSRFFCINQSAQSGEPIGHDVLTMKQKCRLKTILLALMLLLPVLAHSQTFEWKMEPKYFGEIHAGYKTTTKVGGMDTYSAMAELGTVQGVSLNQYLEVGIGVDALMATHYYKNQGLRFGMDAYLDLRPAYPLADNFKVFLDLGLGGFWGIHSTPGFGSGFYCQFGPGIRYRKLNLSFGLQSFGTGGGATAFFSKLGLYF